MRLETLLHTKFNIPLPYDNLVARPHLLKKLDKGLKSGSRLTLISAPAGFGKTTILSDWGRYQGKPVAWLSIDKSDNDVSRFFAYLFAALQSIGLDFVETAPIFPQSSQPPPVEVILTPIINTISNFDAPFILVLDDYHEIESPFIHEALAFLISFTPIQLHIALTTREDPPLPLSRLRGRGQLTELRAADLCFSTNETTSFLNQIMGLNISAEDILKLEMRTEGWITGLQMAAISMQNREDITGFITAFSGSNDYIVGYLSDEVLTQQSEEMQRFLLQTSILDRMTGPLCDALTGRKNGEQTLEQLKKSNLLLQRKVDDFTIFCTGI
jgi:LuxR family maltose regulon positive regulatory protein